MSYNWTPDRPEDYDPTLVYDWEEDDWVVDDGRGGARFKNTLIIIAQNDDGVGRVFVSL